MLNTVALEFQSKIAAPSLIANKLFTRMFSLVAMSSRRHSSSVPLISSSMTACDCSSSSKSATRVDQRATRVYRAPSTGCARISRAGRRAVDADAPICSRSKTGPDSGMSSRRACRCRTSRRSNSTF